MDRVARRNVKRFSRRIRQLWTAYGRQDGWMVNGRMEDGSHLPSVNSRGSDSREGISVICMSSCSVADMHVDRCFASWVTGHARRHLLEAVVERRFGRSIRLTRSRSREPHKNPTKLRVSLAASTSAVDVAPVGKYNDPRCAVSRNDAQTPDYLRRRSSPSLAGVGGDPVEVNGKRRMLDHPLAELITSRSMGR